MQNKREIKICLGSSCFSRGNKEILQIIQTFLREHKLENKVYFHGAHCFSHCENGPIVQIDDKIYDNVNQDNIIEFLGIEFL